jgi:hypothetical protein
VVVVDADRPGSTIAMPRLGDAVTALAWRPGATDLVVGTADGTVTSFTC